MKQSRLNTSGAASYITHTKYHKIHWLLVW
jgi:hypothetical protein